MEINFAVLTTTVGISISQKMLSYSSDLMPLKTSGEHNFHCNE